MGHDLALEPDEARVLGVLIEKELTTPDQYPLSLNALQSGCNQKSNRDPKVTMQEGEVFSSVERLRMMQLAGGRQSAGSRVERFAHNARETLRLGEAELAVLAELLLRGAQTKGELRTRASRMHAFADQAALGEVLGALGERGMVAERPPAPGSRAGRVDETLSARGQSGATVAPTSSSVGAAPPNSAPSAPAAPAVAPSGLEARVARLERQLARLAEALGETLVD